MKEFANETPSELLTQLMDNELDPVNEPSLYDALAHSTELQDEHKYHIALREAIKKDSEAFIPPVATVNSLFSKLGYAPPPPANSVGILRKSPLLLSLFKRAAVPLILLIVGSYGAYTLFDNSNSVSSSAETMVSQNILANHKVENLPISEVKVTSDLVETKLSKTKKIAVMKSESTNNSVLNETLPSNSAKQVSDLSSTENNDTFANTQAELPSIITANSTIVNSSTSVRNINTNRSIPGAININALEMLNQASTGNNISLYVKGLNNFNSELGSAMSNSFGTTDNLSLGISFQGSDKFKWGFEVGQQPFAVMVSDPYNESELINGSKSVFWGLVALKYDIIEMHGARPYLQFSAGFGDFGKGLVRPSIGVEYKPFDLGFSLLAGYEYSLLWYSTQNQPLSTSSDGIFVGISIGL